MLSNKEREKYMKSLNDMKMCYKDKYQDTPRSLSTYQNASLSSKFTKFPLYLS